MTLGLPALWCRLRVSRKQPPKTLDTDVHHPRWALRQANNAEPLHSKHVVERNRRKAVEAYIAPSNAEIPPALAGADVRGSQELLRRAQRTVLALAGCGGVVELPHSAGIEVAGQVLATGLTRRRIEDCKLLLCAANGAAAKPGASPAGDEVGQRTDPVHEDPEAW